MSALAGLFDRFRVDPTVHEWAFDAIVWWAGDALSPEKLVRRAKAALARAEGQPATMTDRMPSELLNMAVYRIRRMP